MTETVSREEWSRLEADLRDLCRTSHETYVAGSVNAWSIPAGHACELLRAADLAAQRVRESGGAAVELDDPARSDFCEGCGRATNYNAETLAALRTAREEMRERVEAAEAKYEAARPAVRMSEWLGASLRTLVNVLSLDNAALDTLYGKKITAQEALDEGRRATEAWTVWRASGTIPSREEFAAAARAALKQGGV